MIMIVVVVVVFLMEGQRILDKGFGLFCRLLAEREISEAAQEPAEASEGEGVAPLLITQTGTAVAVTVVTSVVIVMVAAPFITPHTLRFLLILGTTVKDGV